MSDAPKTPNLLWITLDHVTYHHYRHMAGERPQLPTYERLCREGFEYENCKSVLPLCLPCRASMLTGLYPHHHGKYRNEPEFSGKRDVPLVSERLRDAGYTLGYVGKNHSGYEELDKRGFDWMETEEYGNPYLTEDYRAYLERNHLPHPIYHQEWSTDGMFGKFKNGDYDLTQVDNFNTYSCGTLSGGRVHEVDYLVDAAKNWMGEHRDRPFVLRLDTWGPHHAYQVPEDFADHVLDGEKIQLPPSLHADISHKPGFVRRYLEELSKIIQIEDDEGWRRLLKRAYEQYSYIDLRLGELLAWLEEQGLLENTAVLMTADHGDTLGTSGGMFDKCGDMSEELMEVPMVLYAPWLGGGKRVDSLVSNLDVVPTILDTLGLPVPKDLDGRSLKALAMGEISPRESLMCQHYGHFENYYGQRTLYMDGYKLICVHGERDQLYHIARDPYEMEELSGDPEAAEQLSRMRAELRRQRELFGDEWPAFTRETLSRG